MNESGRKKLREEKNEKCSGVDGVLWQTHNEGVPFESTNDYCRRGGMSSLCVAYASWARMGNARLRPSREDNRLLLRRCRGIRSPSPVKSPLSSSSLREKVRRVQRGDPTRLACRGGVDPSRWSTGKAAILFFELFSPFRSLLTSSAHRGPCLVSRRPREPWDNGAVRTYGPERDRPLLCAVPTISL